MATASVPDLVLANGDDWQGFFLNGQLIAENHRLVDDRHAFAALMSAVGVRLTVGDVDLDWMADNGTLPADLADVQFAHMGTPQNPA